MRTYTHTYIHMCACIFENYVLTSTAAMQIHRQQLNNWFAQRAVWAKVRMKST